MKKQNILYEDVPFHRKVPNTTFVVDYYHKKVTDLKCSFLTHFHSDHYYGLTKTYDSHIYCSETTGNLIYNFIGVDQKKIKKMKMSVIYKIEGISVICYESNHCPGAVGFVFAVDSKIYLHTGDFRFNLRVHENINNLIDIFEIPSKTKFDLVFCDNTYENYHNFDSQSTVIKNVISDIFKIIFPQSCLAPIPTKFIFSSYFIGKEKLFLSVAYFFQWKVKIQQRKQKAFECFSDYSKNELNRSVIEICDNMSELIIPYIKFPCFVKTKLSETSKKLNPLDLISINNEDSEIDVLPMNYINKKKLTELYGTTKYKKFIVFCGTGWSKKAKTMNFTRKNGSTIKSSVNIIQYPYSEHSSSNELLEFRNFIKTNEIIPTVVFDSQTRNI